MQRQIAAMLVALVVEFACVHARAAEQEIPLSELDLACMTTGWGQPQADHNCTGGPLKLGGKVFDRGVGTHAHSTLHIKLDGKAVRFTAVVGVDDQTAGRGSVRFLVVRDGETRFDSGVVKGGAGGKAVDIPLSGAKSLILMTTTAGDDPHFDHANWGAATNWR